MAKSAQSSCLEPLLDAEKVVDKEILAKEKEFEVKENSDSGDIKGEDDDVDGGDIKEDEEDVKTAEEPVDEELAGMTYGEFEKLRDQPDVVVQRFLPELRRRYTVTEKRSKGIEKRLIDLHPANDSVEEDRQEILGELLDKAEQGLDIMDEHEHRALRFGHRACLEGRLLGLINAKLDVIDNIIDRFGVIGNDKEASLNEREFLRYEIRHCDLSYTEIHEAFLKSYLDMDWN